jgi:hypothetical protein
MSSMTSARSRPRVDIKQRDHQDRDVLRSIEKIKLSGRLSGKSCSRGPISGL